MRLDFDDPQLAERVRAADPLGADPVLARLPELNAAADVAALRDALRQLCAAATGVHAPEPALASMRDLGILLGSIRRHGQEPVPLVPGLEGQLVRLADLTGLAPRDMILHYTAWNPRGDRQRTYTGDAMETVLIESVRAAADDLSAAVELTAALYGVPDVCDIPAAMLDRLAGHLDSMVRAMAFVVEGLDPSFFFTGIRPYLDPVRVDGRDWYGPAASQMPVWLLDQALWAGDGDDEEYYAFASSMVDYALPEWAARFTEWTAGPSLGSRLRDALAHQMRAGKVSPRLTQLVEAYAGVLRVLVTFRGRHLAITRRAYAGAPDSLGSGGGSMELLRHILDLSRSSVRPGGR